MLTARSLDMSAPAHPVATHPKDVLYDEVYDPLTRAFFEALALSPERQRLLDTIPQFDLVTNLHRFNTFFYDLVDQCLAELIDQRPGLLEAVDRHRDDVLWVGHMTPTPGADLAAIQVSLGHKIKRNISLGVIEALICLQSAFTFCRETLDLRGEALASTLERSRQLYASLAVLHDEHQKVRFTFLTGIDTYLMYPNVDYHDAIAGRVGIPADRFVVTGPPEARRLRFVAAPVHDVALTSPVRRCPAHRFRSADPELTLNDVLWNLLIDIYRRAGRFA